MSGRRKMRIVAGPSVCVKLQRTTSLVHNTPVPHERVTIEFTAVNVAQPGGTEFWDTLQRAANAKPWRKTE